MNISAIKKMTFKGALTTQERKDLSTLYDRINQKEYGGKLETTIVAPSTSWRYKTHDTGIGTSNSSEAIKNFFFLSNLTGAKNRQELPNGIIDGYNISPYDSTNFSLGIHKIDFRQLTQEEYGKLIPEDVIKNHPFFNQQHSQDKVEYNLLFDEKNGANAIIDIAYNNFKNIKQNDPTNLLIQEYDKFIEENGNWWLNNDAYAQALIQKNMDEARNKGKNPSSAKDITTWSKEDLNAISDNNLNVLNYLDNNYKETMEKYKFVQFIADKQERKTTEILHQAGIRTTVDIPVGFNQIDILTHKKAFKDDFNSYKFGVPLDNSNKAAYWSAGLDYGQASEERDETGRKIIKKINPEVEKLLREKISLAAKRGDCIRIDAAWQYVNPCMVKPEGMDVKKDNEGDTLQISYGSIIENDKTLQNSVIKDIILDEAQKRGVGANDVQFEILGGNSWDSLNYTNGLNATYIHITRYGKRNGSDEWGNIKYYERQAGKNSRYQNLKPGQGIYGIGTHDDNTAISLAKNDSMHKIDYLADDLCLSSKQKEEMRNNPLKRLQAMFAELFTTNKQFITLPDLLGQDVRINKSNTTNEQGKESNWVYCAPENIEKTYYQNLVQNKALNVPLALSMALKAKYNGVETQETKELDKYAELLSEDNGCYSEAEANNLFNENNNRTK